MNMYHVTTLAAAALLGTGLGNAHANIQTNLNETWADGDRSNQSLPDSAAWYSSLASETLTATSADGGSMTQATSSAGQTLAYFTDNGLATLDVGQTMRMTYDISFSGLGTTYIRAGLFNTINTTRVTGDGINSFDANGYIVNIPSPTSGTAVDIRRRNQATGPLMTSITTTYYSSLGAGDSLPESLVNGVIYTGMFEVTRFDTSVNIQASLSRPDGIGGQVVLYDFVKTNTFSTRLWSAFDTVGFAMGGTADSSFTLHAVDIAVIPEPATLSLLGLGVGGLMLLRSRRAKRINYAKGS